MFTPLSTGSERAQDNQWGTFVIELDVESITNAADKNQTPRKSRLRSALSRTPVSDRTAGPGRLARPQHTMVTPRRERMRRVSMGQEEEGEPTWTKLFFRVRLGGLPLIANKGVWCGLKRARGD